MPFNHHNAASARSVVSLWRMLALGLAASCAMPAHALDAGDIIVTSLKGEVHITMNGGERAVRAGSVLELPATVRTGRDGAIDLRQGATSVSVGPDTQLDFPALEIPGGPIDRIQQPRGNAFYDVGKRGSRKLRIETPFLVAVVKGTQFNVAARDDATTIALFEGRLEIRSSDGSEVVDLVAGEIASRHRHDQDIGVIRMDAPGPGSAPPISSTSEDRDEELAPAASAWPELADDEQILAVADLQADLGATETANLVSLLVPDASQLLGDIPVNPAIDLDPGSAMAPALDPISDAGDLDLGVVADAGVPVDLGIGADLGAVAPGDAPAVDVGVDAGLGGLIDAGAGATVDLGGGTVNVDLDTDVNVGGVEVDVGLDLGVDLGDDDGNSGHGNSNGDDNSNPGRGNSRDKDSGLLGELTEDLTNLLDGLRKPGKK